MKEVTYDEDTVDMQKYATGKELKIEKLNLCGQLRESTGIHKLFRKSCQQSKQERIFEIGREKLAKEIDITRVIKTLRKVRRTQALMIELNDFHKKLIENSKTKVLKFSQLAPDLSLSDTSSEDEKKEIHEIEAKFMFDKHRRVRVGSASMNGSNGSLATSSRLSQLKR